ncbi:sorbosone dehydrogenase family protein [Gordonia sp. UCD-TK1]|uniref:PQQ-dependent sugar dehydrogenase n=1 Tax=Gordonia sp. UCD-TK1 TaxID=1857893 RepID=UPI00080E1CAB|nr:PQQ-dependent sugar dehydrogenase [Gordonia sp. UCD-TK1]OCH79967.1 glucose sorbosone dehydrogenase [Gordonia sp. UCD-TK1]
MDRRKLLKTGLLGAGLLGITGTSLVTGCATDDPPTRDRSGSGPTGTSADAASVETVASGLNVPWALAFLGDGDALVTQRDDATVVRVSPGGEVRTVGEFADAAPRGEGGLQGIAVAPGDESAVFVYYTTATDNRLVRLDFDGDRLTRPRPLITGLDAAYNHHGGALAFGSDGSLFVSVGDAAVPEVAQDVRALNGKILRIDRNGRPWPGNPFGNEVHSYGHRNVEGLAFDGAGRLWASEFGQNRRDELNLIRPGGNYGWPEVEGDSDDPRFVAPAATWTTQEASPAGLAIVGDRAYMAALRGRRLWEIPLTESAAGEPVSRYADEFGRLRVVAAAPDGSLWFGTSNTDGRGRPADGDDRLLRMRLG